MKVALLAAALCMIASGALAQQVRKGEPAVGSLKEGVRVLVDDGTCPKGQILEIVGGNVVKQIRRQRRCVPRR